MVPVNVVVKELRLLENIVIDTRFLIDIPNVGKLDYSVTGQEVGIFPYKAFFTPVPYDTKKMRHSLLIAELLHQLSLLKFLII